MKDTTYRGFGFDMFDIVKMIKKNDGAYFEYLELFEHLQNKLVKNKTVLINEDTFIKIITPKETDDFDILFYIPEISKVVKNVKVVPKFITEYDAVDALTLAVINFDKFTKSMFVTDDDKYFLHGCIESVARNIEFWDLID